MAELAVNHMVEGGEQAAVEVELVYPLHLGSWLRHTSQFPL
jgi:hypothetical protein